MNTQLEFKDPLTNIKTKRMVSYSRPTFRSSDHLLKLGEKRLHEIEVVSAVLPFRINNYVINELINWSDPHDPIMRLTVPAREMLSEKDFEAVESCLKSDPVNLSKIVSAIRSKLNPHPSGQVELNRPLASDGEILEGVQHKYSDTVLFFPKGGQTCHSYCTFCFRWPQFVNETTNKFVSDEIYRLVEYLKEHPEVRDLLLTGGDPRVMTANLLNRYIEPLLTSGLDHLKTIRIGSKALAYWPYRFINDPDSDEILRIFEKVVKSGKQLAFMAHFSHPRELETEAAKFAIRRIRSTGAIIRTQSPIMKGINDTDSIWSELLVKQLELGCVPYYMFVARDTGAHDYFAVTLERALNIYKSIVNNNSGLIQTLRGPVLSTTEGKIQILDVASDGENRNFICQMIRARAAENKRKIFSIPFDPKLTWLTINMS
jgi:KamA family protein